MTANEVHLPEEINRLLNSDPFEIEDNVDDNLLDKYQFYMPEIARLYGLVVIEQKREKRNLERAQKKLRSRILLSLNNAIDSQKYKNEDMREAKVWENDEYVVMQTQLDNIEYEIDKTMEFIWKFKNLMNSLSDISKHRISSRKY